MAARPETCTLQLWLLLLLYPSIAKTALTPFDCIEVAGRWLLRADPSVQCYDEAWRGPAALGVVGTLLYSLGFPLLCYRVTRAAHRHAERQAKRDAAASGKPPPLSGHD